MGPLEATLLACVATAALAHDISGSLHHHHVLNIPGYCHSPILDSFPLLSSPVCSDTTLTTKYQASSHTHPAWTRAASCSASANGTDEYCVFTSATFGGGRGISVVTSPQRADFLAQLPAFARGNDVLKHDNVEPDPATAPFEFVHVPGKDMGVVATRPIYRGEHLMSFTPAVVIDYGAFEMLELDEVQRLQTEAVDQLPAYVRGRFLGLSTHDGASGHMERVEKILRTNAFDVDLLDDSDFGLYVVFPESEYQCGLARVGMCVCLWSTKLTRWQCHDSTTTAAQMQTTGSIRRLWCSMCMPRGLSTQERSSVSPT